MMRLDQLLVKQGLAPTRSRAQQLIKHGLVRLADGTQVTSPGMKLDEHVALTIEDHDLVRYVSRAALKLQGAITDFDIKLDGRICVDLGASTGGFCQVMLEHGASFIHAVDVGHDQLHESLRDHAKINNLEHTHVDKLQDIEFHPAPDLLTADLSFISLKRALSVPLESFPKLHDLILLVKPQFELGPGRVNPRGVIHDKEAGIEACRLVGGFLRDNGWQDLQQTPASIQGSDGNQEWVIWAKK